MEVKHTQENNQGKFYIEDEQNETIAFLNYNLEAGVMINAKSTYVEPEYRGQDLAWQLFNAFKEYAQENNLKMLSNCSYVMAQIARTDIRR